MNQAFCLSKKRHPSKTPIFTVFSKPFCILAKKAFKTGVFGSQKKKIKKKTVTIEKNRKHRNTTRDQKLTPKSSKWTNFVERKCPPKVDKLIAFQVAKLITLEWPKSGQTNNSPAYIYIYIIFFCIYMNHVGHFGSKQMLKVLGLRPRKVAVCLL